MSTRTVKTFYSVCGPQESEVNAICEYELNATGEDNNPKDVAQSELKGWLRGPQDVEATIRRERLGVYKVIVRPRLAGNYYLDVTMTGRSIFTKTDMVTEVKTDAQLDRPKITFELEGQGIHAGRAGETSSFTVRVSSGNGAPIDIDHTRLKVTCSGPQTVHATIQRQSMGVYLATFVVRSGGEYTLTVVYDSNNVVTQKVSFADGTSASHSVITSLPPSRTRPNTPVRFSIQAKDSSGRHVSIGGDQWQASALGPERVNRLTITDNQNGTYSGEIIFPAPGAYTIDVTLDGSHAQNSPFKINVEH